MKSKFNPLSIFEEKNIRKQVRSCFLIFKSRGFRGFRLNEILTPDEVQQLPLRNLQADLLIKMINTKIDFIVKGKGFNDNFTLEKPGSLKLWNKLIYSLPAGNTTKNQQLNLLSVLREMVSQIHTNGKKLDGLNSRILNTHNNEFKQVLDRFNDFMQNSFLSEAENLLGKTLLLFLNKLKLIWIKKNEHEAEEYFKNSNFKLPSLNSINILNTKLYKIEKIASKEDIFTLPGNSYISAVEAVILDELNFFLVKYLPTERITLLCTDCRNDIDKFFGVVEDLYNEFFPVEGDVRKYIKLPLSPELIEKGLKLGAAAERIIQRQFQIESLFNLHLWINVDAIFNWMNTTLYNNTVEFFKNAKIARLHNWIKMNPGDCAEEIRFNLIKKVQNIDKNPLLNDDNEKEKTHMRNGLKSIMRRLFIGFLKVEINKKK